MHAQSSSLLTSTLKRRDFLGRIAALAGAATFSSQAALAMLNADAGKNDAGIPMRTLGRTQAKVTILGLGSAPVGLSKPGVAAGAAVYRAALEAGINYVDTAHIYDEAERYLGELMPEFRDRIFLATKALPQSENPVEAAKEMQGQFEESLRRLKTSHVDLLHVHSIGDKSPQHILAPGGPLAFACKMKEKGLARFVGVTGHNRAARFEEVIASDQVDVVMVALNFVDGNQYNFEEQILPVARKHHCGIIAMKVFGGHSKGLAAYPTPGPAKMPLELMEESLRYSLDIEGVGLAVVGAYKTEEVLQNVEWAKKYRPLTADEKGNLRETGKKLVAEWGPRFGPVS